MKKPPQELIDAFFKWYPSDPHYKNEDYYSETITRYPKMMSFWRG